MAWWRGGVVAWWRGGVVATGRRRYSVDNPVSVVGVSRQRRVWFIDSVTSINKRRNPELTAPSRDTPRQGAECGHRHVTLNIRMTLYTHVLYTPMTLYVRMPIAHPCDVNIIRTYVQRHTYVHVTLYYVLRGCDAAVTCRTTMTCLNDVVHLSDL